MPQDAINPSPDRRCSNCNSFRVVNKEGWNETRTFVVLYTYCNSCRTKMIYWSGSRIELAAFRRKQNFVKRKMKYAARLAEQAGRRALP